MIIDTENIFETEDKARLKSPSLSQQAYEMIRRKIISLELPPGAIVDESSLQKELNLGRTPIREALLRLSLEQLVTIVPRRGIFVTEISITDLKQLFEVRIVLESLAARLAARRGSEEQWRLMEETLANLPPAGSANINETLIAIDERCHHIIYEAADNEFLQSTLFKLYALSLRLWFFFLLKIGDMHEAIQQHRDILEALKKRDAKRASDLLEHHIRAFQEEIQAAMLGRYASEE